MDNSQDFESFMESLDSDTHEVEVHDSSKGTSDAVSKIASVIASVYIYFSTLRIPDEESGSKSVSGVRANKSRARIVACVILAVAVLFTMTSPIVGTDREQDPILYQQEVVAIGDSTMALSQGVEDEDQENVSPNHHTTLPCLRESDTWVSMLKDKTISLACPGATTKDAIDIAKNTLVLGERTKRVYVSIGSNDFKAKRTVEEITDGTQRLIDIIRQRSPESEIVFVGYTLVPLGKCMNKNESLRARLLNSRHYKADETMKEIMSKTPNAYYVDVSELDYNICDKSQAMVRLPGTTHGALWHTTLIGHEKIAAKVNEEIGSVDSGIRGENKDHHQLPPVNPLPRW